MWGGGATPILPTTDKAGLRESPYSHAMELASVDDCEPLRSAPQSPGWGEDFPALMMPSATAAAPGLRTIEVADLAADDPWSPIYACTLGSLPDAPDPRLLREANLREGTRFDSFIPVAREAVTGSLADLLQRVRRVPDSPRQFSLFGLSHGLKPDASFISSFNSPPGLDSIKRAAGPNIVVVIGTPSTVDDLALLWNLRGAHGVSGGLPIGVPLSELELLCRELASSEGLVQPFGLGVGTYSLSARASPSKSCRRRFLPIAPITLHSGPNCYNLARARPVPEAGHSLGERTDHRRRDLRSRPAGAGSCAQHSVRPPSAYVCRAR